MAKFAALCQFKDMFFGSKTASLKLGEILNRELKLDLDWDYQRCEFYSDQGTNGIENTLACFGQDFRSGTRLIERIKKKFGESSDIYLQKVEGEGYAVILGQKYLSKIKPRDAFPDKLKVWLDFANWESERLEILDQDTLVTSYETLSTEVMPNNLAELLFEKLENERSLQRLDLYEYKLVRYANGSRIHRVPSAMPQGADELGALTDLSDTYAPSFPDSKSEKVAEQAAVVSGTKKKPWISALKHAATAITALAITYYATTKDKLNKTLEFVKEPVPIEQKSESNLLPSTNSIVEFVSTNNIPAAVKGDIVEINSEKTSLVEPEQPLVKSEQAVSISTESLNKPVENLNTNETNSIAAVETPVNLEITNLAVPKAEMPSAKLTANQKSAESQYELAEFPNLKKYFAKKEKAKIDPQISAGENTGWLSKVNNFFSNLSSKLKESVPVPEIKPSSPKDLAFQLPNLQKYFAGKESAATEKNKPGWLQSIKDNFSTLSSKLKESVPVPEIKPSSPKDLAFQLPNLQKYFAGKESAATEKNKPSWLQSIKDNFSTLISKLKESVPVPEIKPSSPKDLAFQLPNLQKYFAGKESAATEKNKPSWLQIIKDNFSTLSSKLKESVPVPEIKPSNPEDLAVQMPNLQKYIAEQERAATEANKPGWLQSIKDKFSTFKSKLDLSFSDSEALSRFTTRADNLTFKAGSYEEPQALHSWAEGMYRFGDRLNGTYVFSGVRLTDTETEPYAGIKKDLDLTTGPVRTSASIEYVLADPSSETKESDNLEIASGRVSEGLNFKFEVTPAVPYYDSQAGLKLNIAAVGEVEDQAGAEPEVQRLGLKASAEQVLVANPEITRDLYAAASLEPGINNQLSDDNDFGVTGSLALKGRWGKTFADLSFSARMEEQYGLNSAWSLGLRRYLGDDLEFGLGYGSDTEMWPNAFGDKENDPSWEGFKALLRKRF